MLTNIIASLALASSGSAKVKGHGIVTECREACCRQGAWNPHRYEWISYSALQGVTTILESRGSRPYLRSGFPCLLQVGLSGYRTNYRAVRHDPLWDWLSDNAADQKLRFLALRSRVS
jgi:hypothetical protein